MESEFSVTRRRALQGMLGLTAAAALPIKGSANESLWSDSGQGGGRDASEESMRLQQLTDGWRFHRGDVEGAETHGFVDAGWRLIDVPHDWSIEDLPGVQGDGRDAVWTEAAYPLHTGPFDRYASEGEGATGWTVGGVGWYRKTFTRPLNTAHGKVEVRFEGVYMNCKVWINGVLLGAHPYGYTPFSFDLTSHLRDGANVLAVRVNNAGKNSRWYSGSGIYRKVWLSNAGDLRIPENGIYVTTPEISRDVAVVHVEVKVESGLPTDTAAKVRVRFKDNDGAVAAESESGLTFNAGAVAKVTSPVQIKNPHLWSTSDPHLYSVEVLVESGSTTVDSKSIHFGFRKLELDASQGLRINGESIKLRGGCVHHDNGPLGAAAIPRAEERRVEILKANGFNAIRTSHNPPSIDFLDACDRLGMLVIDEAFDCWETGKNPDDYHLYFKDWWQRDLEAMILRDRNHPSIILWSIGNEIPERAEPDGLEIGKALAQHAHDLDPTRKVTAAICGPWDHPKKTWQDMQPAFNYLDVGGYNYESAEYEKDHAKFPDRIMVGTESVPAQALQPWNSVEEFNWVIGDFVWTAIDYLGESGLGHVSIAKTPTDLFSTTSYPWFNAYCGDIDLIGNKKPQSYFRDVVWRRSPLEMAIQRPVPTDQTEKISAWGWSDELRSWTWPGFEGKPLNVRVYTRGDRVKLFLNNTELGAKNLTEKDGLRAEFTVNYDPGELRAVAFDGDKEIGRVDFKTAGKAHKIVLTADRERLRASRDDLSYIMAQVVDEAGRLVPTSVLPVTFSIEGVGEIAAVGNANPKDLASLKQQERDTFHGVCVAIVRPRGEAGSITMRAASKGLQSGQLNLQVSAEAEQRRFRQ